MIKLNNLEKYFNRNKSNEIHVINNINLTLPDKGLVVLLGPSGSGKTTLLNVLGGLDKIQSGMIQFDQEQIHRYSSVTWDRIRNKYVGYIFQNYNLLTNLTVYDNIALTLNMVNIYEKEEIDKRIDYILDSMGMINYRKRRASQLSGGQQQRVAIARALAKNPKVIIADEPTGNLDSKNTQDIMDIIKKISQNKLVVLVTHEENIANFYGDRIIRLKDGQVISDEQNSSSGSLDVKHDTDIYLGELREVENQSLPSANLSIFSDEDINDDLDIRLIVKNKTIYVDVKSKEYQKKQLLESDSEIKILEGKYEKRGKDSFVESEFDLQSIITEKQETKERHSVITIKDSIKLALSRLSGASRLGKLFYVGFAGGAILIAIAVGMLSGIFNMDPARFLTGPKESVVFDKDEMDYDEIKTLIDDPSVNYLEVFDELTLIAKLPPIFQNNNTDVDMSANVVFADYMDESKLVLGREVQSYREFVIDADVADGLLSSSQYNYLGVTTYQDLMRIDYAIELPGSEGMYTITIKLVGIIDDDSTVAYAQKELIYMAATQKGLYDVFEDSITITNGSNMDDEFDMLIYETDDNESPIALNTMSMYDTIFRATGEYTSEVNVPLFLLRADDLEKAYFEANYTMRNADISVHANDKEAFIALLKAQEIEAESSYDKQITEYRLNRISESLSAIIFTVVVLGASAISYYFILRSSLLSRIYEVSVYRALGVTKGDIRKMFLVEIVIITSITSLIGYLATSFIMYRIQILAADYMDIIHISALSIVAGVIIIFLVNIVAGLIPVTNLLRKTPAEILSKYDF